MIWFTETITSPVRPVNEMMKLHPETAAARTTARLEAKPMDNSVIIDAVRAALAKGGQHILMAPDGSVSIWPDNCECVVRCKDCKNWGYLYHADGPNEICHITEMITEADDYCSYAEAIEDADDDTGEMPVV